MEEIAIKKDETPYVIFACKKCKEFSYVKTVQRTKKCLRCGRVHQVCDILKNGEIVYGMTEAVNNVKRKQDELALPEFRSGHDFIIASNKFVRIKNSKRMSRNNDHEIDYNSKFNDMLLELSKHYRRFPLYMLELMIEDYGISTLELKTLIRSAEKNGLLIKDGENDMYYRFQVNISQT